MNAANAGFFRIVNLGVLHAFVMQIFKSLFSLRLEFIQLAEHDGFRGTRLGAGRFQACFLAIGAEGALEGAAIVRIALNHSEADRKRRSSRIRCKRRAAGRRSRIRCARARRLGKPPCNRQLRSACRRRRRIPMKENQESYSSNHLLFEST